MKKYLFIVLYIANMYTVIAQNSNVFSDASKIFDEYEKEMFFLKNSEHEVDSINDSINNLLLIGNINLDSISIKREMLLLHKSFEKFTLFNSIHLANLSSRIKDIHPIRGSEITYLNKSFQVFVKYEKTYDIIANKSKILLKKTEHNILYDNILSSDINKLLFFYKNYFTAIKSMKIRRVLNAEDKSFNKHRNELKKLAKNLYSHKYYNKIKKNKRIKNDGFTSLLIDTTLYNAVKNSTYTKSRIKRDKNTLNYYFRSDNAYKTRQFFTQQISGAIGNFLGMFRFRKGHLYKNDSVVLAVIEKLKPMDILAEKTGFALTDKLIPGHFGHIAIWLGTEEQLKAQNLWNSSIIKPFQNRIRLGYTILETDRKGTHLKTLQKFMNIDEIAILRIHGFDNLPRDEKLSIYQDALAQLGKEYDFNFDVETSDKLVCSELLYQVFGSIHWPTDTMLKRTTISPDNVLSLALYKNSPIYLTYYLTARSTKKLQNKNIDDLATNLGIIKKDTIYMSHQKRCEKKYDSQKKRRKKVCETINQPLIYN